MEGKVELDGITVGELKEWPERYALAMSGEKSGFRPYIWCQQGHWWVTTNSGSRAVGQYWEALREWIKNEDAVKVSKLTLK